MVRRAMIRDTRSTPGINFPVPVLNKMKGKAMLNTVAQGTHSDTEHFPYEPNDCYLLLIVLAKL